MLAEPQVVNAVTETAEKVKAAPQNTAGVDRENFKGSL